jgi:hypothetical protein
MGHSTSMFAVKEHRQECLCHRVIFERRRGRLRSTIQVGWIPSPTSRFGFPEVGHCPLSHLIRSKKSPRICQRLRVRWEDL